MQPLPLLHAVAGVGKLVVTAMGGLPFTIA